MMTYENILENEEVLAFLRKGNEKLGALGFTDHSSAHCAIVANRAGMLLETLGYSEKEIERAKIAGFMHDIGNAINRKNHAEYGGILSNDILKNTDMELDDRVAVVGAISNHDESTGGAYDVVSAALIIADKTDVRRNRVRTKDKAEFDIHDRVNYAVTAADLEVDKEKKTITLSITLDEKICSMFDYFDIFLGRMMMCRRAAERLGVKFKLEANGSKVV